MHYILILSVLGVTIWARRNYLPIIVCLQKGEYQRGLRHWYSSFFAYSFPACSSDGNAGNEQEIDYKRQFSAHRWVVSEAIQRMQNFKILVSEGSIHIY